MKLILEYRQGRSHWQSFGPEIIAVTHIEVEKKMFGYWHIPTEGYSDHESWYDYEERTRVFVDSGFTLAARNCPQVVSIATLNNLYKFEDTGELTEAQVPISKSTLKVEPQNVALLSIYEYETCLNGTQSILEYEAILAAAKHIEDCSNDVRLFVFRN